MSASRWALRCAGFVVFASCAAGQTSFLVAGHAYGPHGGDNLALWPPLREALQREDLGAFDFIVFAGDFVRRGDAAGFAALQSEIEALPIRSYFVLGNHDVYTAAGRDWMSDRHGGPYYRFEHGGCHFVVLDSQAGGRSIPPEQVDFLRESAARVPDGGPLFVFVHELLWLSTGDRYRHVRANGRSRQASLQGSNYWEDVHPVLRERPGIEVYVIAGDVGGNPDAIPAFYERVDGVTLIATGMGEIAQSNYLRVHVSEAGARFSLAALDRAAAPLPPLEYFEPEMLSRLNRNNRPMSDWALAKRWVSEHSAWLAAATLAVVGALAWSLRRLRRAV